MPCPSQTSGFNVPNYVSSDLGWGEHVTDTAGKAWRALHFVMRVLRKGSDKSKEIAYKSLVRPVTVYGAACWDPYRLEHIKTLEKIKKRALKYCRKNSPLKWDTLTDMRTRIRLCALFKTYTEAVRFLVQTRRRQVIGLQTQLLKTCPERSPLLVTNFCSNRGFVFQFRVFDCMQSSRLGVASNFLDKISNTSLSLISQAHLCEKGKFLLVVNCSVFLAFLLLDLSEYSENSFLVLSRDISLLVPRVGSVCPLMSVDIEEKLDRCRLEFPGSSVVERWYVKPKVPEHGVIDLHEEDEWEDQRDVGETSLMDKFLEAEQAIGLNLEVIDDDDEHPLITFDNHFT
ncbi:hypothetical protein ANN_12072 [Periplaneta americana]|uniref:Uncharacterized protein n=1 Tax=Periplaneta americana TaxID=6978 RepID=A0ABQ8T7Z5_PERAM|nr:hypothetical protein ANN_12072 [Periplaneta americana]